MTIVRDAVEADSASIVKLNDAEVQQTSPMDTQRLCLLRSMATFCKVVTVRDQVAAFLIALPDGAPYENDNYAWFASRLDGFLYVDRIVVGSGFAGRGLGSKMYASLFEFARMQGIGSIVCEYNLEPPNPASKAFHDKFGFKELGTQWVAGGSKQVSLQVAKT